MSSDITSKRLISLAPEEWVRWASQVADVGECEIIGSEFQFVSRNTDTLIHVKESALGEFLTLFEFQTHYTPKMPRRMRAYAGLAEEKFELPVLPILINILPYTLPIPNFYESNFAGLRVRQDFRVINLWEISAEDILRQNLIALIPFLPTMRGGQDETLLQRAQATLQLDENLREIGRTRDFETALSLFASAVLGLDNAKRILRWTMLDIIVESPLYQEIVSQGLQQGLQQGRAEEIRKVLLKFSQKRFGQIDAATTESMNELSLEKAEALTEKFLDLESIADLQDWLAKLQN